MAVFDVAQQVISRSGGLISGSTSVSDATLTAMQATLEGMDLGPLLGLYLQTFVVQVTMLALSAHRVWPNGGNISHGEPCADSVCNIWKP